MTAFCLQSREYRLPYGSSFLKDISLGQTKQWQANRDKFFLLSWPKGCQESYFKGDST